MLWQLAMDSKDSYEVTPTPFPASTKTASATIKGLETVATAVYFADKILITVTQNGRLAHWVSSSVERLICRY